MSLLLWKEKICLLWSRCNKLFGFSKFYALFFLFGLFWQCFKPKTQPLDFKDLKKCLESTFFTSKEIPDIQDTIWGIFGTWGCWLAIEWLEQLAGNLSQAWQNKLWPSGCPCRRSKRTWNHCPTVNIQIKISNIYVWMATLRKKQGSWLILSLPLTSV